MLGKALCTTRKGEERNGAAGVKRDFGSSVTSNTELCERRIKEKSRGKMTQSYRVSPLGLFYSGYTSLTGWQHSCPHLCSEQAFQSHLVKHKLP